jgi:3'-5' exoribonuclease
MTPKHPQKGPFAQALTPGERITGFYLARRKQLEPFRDRTKGQYLTLVLGDRSGDVIARVWENAHEVEELFNEGDILKIQGDVEEYLGRTQLIVQKLRVAQSDEYDLADFLPATERDVDAMLAEVEAVMARIANPHLAALVQSFYNDLAFRSQLAQAPATRRVHHAYLGGVLEQLTDVLKLCDAVLALYPELDSDLLLTGALLHGVGKVREYSWAQEIEYTDEGRLIGHIVLSAEMVAAAVAALPDFPTELGLRVRHMLVSQHGRYEWGSPRRPQTLEAIALHHIQDLSAQLNRFSGLLKSRRTSGQSWTEYDRLLGRQLYAGPEDEPANEDTERVE